MNQHAYSGISFLQQNYFQSKHDFLYVLEVSNSHYFQCNIHIRSIALEPKQGLQTFMLHLTSIDILLRSPMRPSYSNIIWSSHVRFVVYLDL